MRNQRGLASVVTVTVMIVLITLISLGFARIMDRSAQNSRNNQASSAATYAAQSAINDVADFIKGNTTAYSTQCTGNNSLIGDKNNPGPFYDDSNLSGDKNTQYTCILLNQTPTDLVYQALPVNKSRVVKMTTSAFTGAMDKMMISWQSTNPNVSGFPPNSTTFYDETTWNDSSHNYTPMLRVTIYPIPVGGSLANIQSNSRTVFLSPRGGAGLVPLQSYPATSDGSVIPVTCVNNVPGGAFDGTADYRCNVIFTNLSTSTLPDKLDYLYVRITPIYNQADIKIKANDMWGQQLKFIGVQAVVDATAKSADVAKRLQARVDIGGTTSGSQDDNIAPTNDQVPEFSLRSANALCKRFRSYASYYNYTDLDAPEKVCHMGIVTNAPTLALSITGQNGPDNNRTVDSQANNPDSPQNPVQQGTVYVNNPGAVRINWTSTDAAYNCNASGGWSGDKNPSSSWSGVTGTGSQNISGITTVTNYNMQCSGPGGTTPTRTVKAWPHPTASISAPSSYPAGDPFTVSWSSTNAINCNMSGYWDASNIGTSGSRTFYTSWNDHSTKQFTVSCYDPIGRTGTASAPNGAGGGVTPTSPRCSASAAFGGGTYTTNAYITWSASCPEVSPTSGTYLIDTNVPGIGSGYANPIYRTGYVRITQPGSYHFRITAQAPGWSGGADSGYQTVTITYPPIVLDGYSVGNMVWYRHDYSGCVRYDGLHPWYICNIDVRVHQEGVPPTELSCTLYSDGSNVGTWTAYYGWPGDQLYSPSWSNDNYGNWQLGYYGSQYSASPHTIQWRCHSRASNTDLSTPPVTRYPDYPPTCEQAFGPNWHGIWPDCTYDPPIPTGGGGSSGGGSSGGCGIACGGPSTCPPGQTGYPNCHPVIGCFIAGTSILTPNGPRPIEQIKMGDWIMGWDPREGKIPVRVTQTFVHYSKQTLWIVTSGGSVTTTSIHPFWDGHKWIDAGSLIPGKSYIQDSTGKLQKVLFVMKGNSQTVYNLEVGNSNHDYFANGFLVHNKVPPL